MSFCYPGYATSEAAAKLLGERGYLFARAGGAKAFDPAADNPLLMPQAFDGKPDSTLEQFKAAVAKAKDGKIAVMTFHGVPDMEHPPVSLEPATFRAMMQYLKDHHYHFIPLRDPAKYIAVSKAAALPLTVESDK